MFHKQTEAIVLFSMLVNVDKAVALQGWGLPSLNFSAGFCHSAYRFMCTCVRTIEMALPNSKYQNGIYVVVDDFISKVRNKRGQVQYA